VGQINQPTVESIILTDLDRLIAANAGGGIPQAVSHIILLGEDAGQNLLASDVIILGHDSGKNVPASATNLIVMGQNSGNGMASAGAIVIGAGSLNGPLNASAANIMAIGNQIAPLLTNANIGTGVAPLLIGSNILTSYTTTTAPDLIAIGRNIVPAHSATGATLGPQNSVLIGSDIKLARNTTSGTDGQEIMIGHNIMRAMTIGSSNKSIMVGCNIFLTQTSNAFGASNSIIIGHDISAGSASDTSKLTNSILIGHNITCSSTVNATSGGLNSVWIGTNGEVRNCDNSVFIGYNYIAPGTAAARSDRNTVIGSNNNFNLGTWSNGIVIGNNNSQGGAFGTTMQLGNVAALAQSNFTVFAARFTTGNTVLGRAPDFPIEIGVVGSTNAIMLIDGTRGAGNPVGGGFFYSLAGALHWVGSAGTDTVVAPA
jgi:hypothetical protein